MSFKEIGFFILLSVVVYFLTARSSEGVRVGDQKVDHSWWITDFSEAQKLSKESGKPMLVNFTGSDWCHYCVELEKDVFGTSDFRLWASQNVIPVFIDFPKRTQLEKKQADHNNALAQKYGIQGFPTVLFMNAEGGILGRSGYIPGGPEVWIEDAEGQLKK